MSSTGHASGEAVPDVPSDFGRHNMFVFGHGTVFLSHLPMFMAPHDAQLILEVALGNADGSLQEVWSRERESHPDERVYTMMPEKSMQGDSTGRAGSMTCPTGCWDVAASCSSPM